MEFTMIDDASVPENLNFVVPKYIEPNCFEIDQHITDHLESILNTQFEQVVEEIDLPKKRGRKKLRPLNPIKTEIMDKFWLRGFRNFMKNNFFDLESYLSDTVFWKFFLGKGGNPGKKRNFLSYNREYKGFLSSNKSFCEVFISWAFIYGCIKVPRKNFKGNWELYYHYLFTDLVQVYKKNIDIVELKHMTKAMMSVYKKNLVHINEKLKLIDNQVQV